MKKQFKLLSGTSPGVLEHEVQRYLDEDWELHGIVFTGVMMACTGPLIHQAVVKSMDEPTVRHHCLNVSCLQIPETDALYCKLHDPFIGDENAS